MCGIAGYYTKNRQANFQSDILQRMLGVLSHRGPDDQGTYASDDHVGLGNARLSIIDLANGHQPFISEDGNVIVVQNGEIYNYLELAQALKNTPYPCRTHSDTEVILRLYQKEGIRFISKLNGMFSIAIYDKREDALYLIRDRIGIKPLFTYQSQDFLFFGSEIKSLLAAGIPRQMNHEALHHFLSFNYVPPPYTMFEGVQHLMPGHWMRLQGNQQTVQCYWDLAHQQVQQRSDDEWGATIRETLQTAVDLRLRADVPYGAFLSGGIDSSTVVGMMSARANQSINTYSIGFHNQRYDESIYAEEAARRFNTRHHMRRIHTECLQQWPEAIYYCDQPHGDVSFIPTYYVSKLASQDVKVVLTGDGGDELFAGYDKYVDFFAQHSVDTDHREAFYRQYFESISLLSSQDKLSLYHPSIRAQMESRNSYDVVVSAFDRSSHMDPINQALYIDCQFLLPGNNLVKPDRMAMAVSLEARTPFLDVNMMELAFQIPGELKLKNRETKFILKKAVKDLIGEKLAYREKRMFTVPIGDWFRDSAQTLMREVLFSERALSRQLFSELQVEKIVEAHCSGAENFTRELRALMAVEIWCQQFMDQQRLDSINFEQTQFTQMGSFETL